MKRDKHQQALLIIDIECKPSCINVCLNRSVFRQNFVSDKYHLNVTHSFIFATQMIFGVILKVVIFYIFAKANFCIGPHVC